MNDDNKKIEGIINNLFSKENRFSRAYNNFSIEQIWRDTFGQVISGYTSSVKFRDGVLTVVITSAPLKQEMVMSKDKVLSKLNKALKYKKVTELIIK